MNTKTLFTALAVCAFSTTVAFAQDGKMSSKDDGKKMQAEAEGVSVKTKMADDGKMKAKAKDNKGNRMKSTAKPRKDDMMGSKGVMVGGAMMTPDKDIVDNAAGSKDHTTLVAAVKAANLVETLKSAGPFTVFAPTNAAFAKLPAGTVDKLLVPEMKGQLATILTYHVVSGRLLASDLRDGMKLNTVEGEALTVMKKGNEVMLQDAKGGMSKVTIANVVSSNGVTHVVDTVLMPSK